LQFAAVEICYIFSVSKNVDDEDDDDDNDDSVSVEETEPKSDENTQLETDKVTSDLEKLKVDEQELPADKAANIGSSEVDNRKEPAAAAD
jgi:hypothetical protein